MNGACNQGVHHAISVTSSMKWIGCFFVNFVEMLFKQVQVQELRINFWCAIMSPQFSEYFTANMIKTIDQFVSKPTSDIYILSRTLPKVKMVKRVWQTVKTHHWNHVQEARWSCFYPAWLGHCSADSSAVSLLGSRALTSSVFHSALTFSTPAI